jgi:hypothetical protein
MINHTIHSVDQCRERGYDPQEVLERVNQHAAKIERSNAGEVIVIVKRFKARITLTNGDSGDVVVAFIDPLNRTIKTVTMQRWGQVHHKAQHSQIIK